MKKPAKIILTLCMAASMTLALFGCFGRASGPQWTVTFALIGGTGDFPAQTVRNGHTAARPDIDPTRDGMEFVGWSSAAAAFAEFDFGAAIRSHTTIWAFWKTPGAALITITLDPNGGIATVLSVQIERGNGISILPAPTRAGYVFMGWTTERNNADTLVDRWHGFSTATTLFALWVEASDPRAVIISSFDRVISVLTAVEISLTWGERTERVRALVRGQSVTAFYEYSNWGGGWSRHTAIGGFRYSEDFSGGEWRGEREPASVDWQSEFYWSIIGAFSQVLRIVVMEADIISAGGEVFTMFDGEMEVVINFANGNAVMTGEGFVTYSFFTGAAPFTITAPTPPAGSQWQNA